MKKTILIIVLVAACAAAGDAATRSARIHGVGPRLGFTINPDQFHFGGHLDIGDLAPRLMMMPNIEIGVGQNLTTVAPTFELDYRFRSEWGAVWTPYVGGGVGPIFYSTHHGDYIVQHGGSDNGLGLYAQAGIAKSISGAGNFFIEFKLGLADAPDAKFTIGWTFGR
jgi:hypothetical protein